MTSAQDILHQTAHDVLLAIRRIGPARQRIDLSGAISSAIDANIAELPWRDQEAAAHEIRTKRLCQTGWSRASDAVRNARADAEGEAETLKRYLWRHLHDEGAVLRDIAFRERYNGRRWAVVHLGRGRIEVLDVVLPRDLPFIASGHLSTLVEGWADPEDFTAYRY